MAKKLLLSRPEPQGCSHSQWQSPDGASLHHAEHILPCNRPSLNPDGISIGAAVFPSFTAGSRCTYNPCRPHLMGPLKVIVPKGAPNLQVTTTYI